MNWIHSRYGVYRGFKLPVWDIRSRESVLLVTDCPAIAQELDFAPYLHGKFTGWVPYSEVTQIMDEKWRGELEGEWVWIQGEEGDLYHIVTRAGRALAAKWGLNQEEPGEWSGNVPKSALSRVWQEVTWLKRPE